MTDDANNVSEFKEQLLRAFENELAPIYARQDQAFQVIADCAEELDKVVFQFKEKGLNAPEMAERINTVPRSIYARIKRHKDRIETGNDGSKVVNG